MGFLCIDIGGTNTLFGIGNGEFELVDKKKSGEFLQDIEGTINEMLSKSQIEKIEDIAVAAAGPIDREKGVFYPPNIEEEKIRLVEPLENFADVSLINDCTSAVIGEHHYGDHGVDNLVYLTISSGIGAGTVIDNKVLEGWQGNFGEVGHMVLENDGLECGCGGSGHWEAYCSGNSIPRMAENLTGKAFQDALEVFESYYDGDEHAEKVIEEMQQKNSLAISKIVNLFNPEKIVLGGAVALNHPELIAGDLQERVKSESVNEVPDIEICELGERAVLHGLRAVCNGKYNS